eukprot:6109724-Prymnesium_polylepis.1
MSDCVPITHAMSPLCLVTCVKPVSRPAGRPSSHVLRPGRSTVVSPRGRCESCALVGGLWLVAVREISGKLVR